MTEIVNKVSESGLMTIDPSVFYTEGIRVELDIKPLLIEEVLLKEKDFREFVSHNNWSDYKDKFVAVHCSSDAIIPVWAYMLVASALQPYAKKVFFGTLNELEASLFHDQLSKFDPTKFQDARVVIKGCGDIAIPVAVYMELTNMLRPYVKSIMYGEPCSTVPVYKIKK